ncbi:YsnF/AvaK domain-containing protein [Desulfitobacterium sp.]|uniref:YsnF/AvaK domain-containing protein n=1 Tax=Desulfitobacterium sp. TaxID=49981 RepID=UPI002C9A6BAC|nr:YsnF/AvaK domain-containing protein [Desulfitobacterium sp.]HVJ48863.1 YsnF/AvaK domain-containing protein [Desulfitobacterium sp.]
MGIFDAIFGNGEDTKKETNNEDATLLLRKEELNIDKSSVQTGEVELSKEIIEEQKIVDVPIKREEVVIERRTLNNEQSDSPITDEETIRIPVSEERVEVDKRTVVSGEISAHKRDVEDTKHIDETLKREEARVNKIGNPDLVDEVTDQDYH